jgi:hypothetical protein
MDPNHKLLRDKRDLFSDPNRYCQAVGKLNYLAITRPDILYAVNVASHFLEPIIHTLGCCYLYCSIPEESFRSGHIV